MSRAGIENFFDRHPVFYPWPLLLRKAGFAHTYKPREVWWKRWIEKTGFKKEKRILDVGCGEGVLLDRLTSEFKVKGFGIDISRQSIKRAKQRSLFPHCLEVADACLLPFPDNYFDAVISFDALEHIESQEKAVSEMVRVLKPGGKVLIYTINKRQRFTFNWFLNKVGIDVYERFNHRPQLFVEPDWLEAQLKKQGIIFLRKDYFNSFFTLLADELCVLFLMMLNRILDFKKTEKFGKIMLRTLTIVSRILEAVGKVLDWPWAFFGYSNGFITLGVKK